MTEPTTRSLLLATAVAFLVALLVLVLFVLPAEYGIDPTGVGAMAGVTRLAPQDGGEPAADGARQDDGPAPTNGTVVRTYESSFPTSSRTTLEKDGYLAAGDTVLIPFDITSPNVTKVTMRLEFIDANRTASGGTTRPDTFEIELKAPSGDVTGGVLVRSDEKTGGGHGRATFEARTTPPPRTWDAANAAEAREAFARNDPPDTSHTGKWSARVTLVESQGGDVQGLPTPGAEDAGNTWSIVVTVQTYALEVAEKPGTERRQDTLTITVPAKGELEYKLAMAMGGRIDYSWRTDGAPLYFDFHGEKEGDASGAFTRHRNGDAAQDAGSLVAPFDGRHGWYWRNDGAAPVTLTLDLRGQYAIVGRV